MKRRIAIAAVVLAGALAAWWWSPPVEAAPGEAIAASAPEPPRQLGSPIAQRVEIHAMASATAGAVFTGRVSSSEDGSPVPRERPRTPSS